MNNFKPYIAYAPLSQELDGSSHALALPQQARSGDAVRIVVAGTSNATIWFGDSSATAQMTMLSNSIESFALDEGVTHVVVDGSAGSTVEVTMGIGA